MENPRSNVKLFSMTEFFVARMLKLAAFGHAGFGDLVNEPNIEDSIMLT